MNNRVVILSLVVVTVVFFTVTIAMQRANGMLMNRLVAQQGEILDLQRKISDQLIQEPSKSAGGSQTASLEKKIDGLLEMFKSAQAGGAQRKVPPPEDLSKVYDISVAHSTVIGKKEAPVTIVEFVDFECPYCARFHPPLVEAAKAYPEKVNYIIKNFPLNFHKNAKSAAKAAFAAGEQGKYSEMVDALLVNGKNLGEEKYEELAKSLGLNVKKFLKDYKDKDAQWEDYIQKDMALGAKVGVRGTPSFYINGRKTNARDVASFKKEIDEILKSKK